MVEATAAAAVTQRTRCLGLPKHTYRRSLHDVPPHRLVAAALAEVQQVVHHHLANQVVAGEAVEVVDGEVQLPGVQLVERDAELEGLVEHGVQRLPVHLREAPPGGQEVEAVKREVDATTQGVIAAAWKVGGSDLVQF